MKSQYFLIKTISNKKMYAKTNEKMTPAFFLSSFMDIAKEATPITQEEYESAGE